MARSRHIVHMYWRRAGDSIGWEDDAGTPWGDDVSPDETSYELRLSALLDALDQAVKVRAPEQVVVHFGRIDGQEVE